MSIYRGPGGSGDAVNDSSSEATLVAQLVVEAQADADAAAASATAVAGSASTASTQATNAANSATAAASSASSASSSASSATSSASAASASATNAANSATAAQTAETNAETAETNAETAQAAAEAAQLAAELAETNAETAETNAETAETNAANSASAASTSATNASNSASAASTSATNASNSASAASTSASNAATSESNASTSASTATTQAGIATTQASNASTSASNAATSATNASNSASAASTSATNASNSASAAATSETNAAASFDSFDDRYLGAKSSAPTLDNDGNTLLVGALYFNSVDSAMKVWNGTAWLDAYASLSGALIATNNLSDLTNTTTARSNLGVTIGTNVQAWDADLDTWATKTAPSGTVVGTSDSQTLTNKTLTTPVISSITNTGTLTLPTSTDTLVGRATTDTLTNKTLTNPTINGFTGDTSVVNLGSGQFYKDTSGNVGIGTSSVTAGFKADIIGSTRVQGSVVADTTGGGEFRATNGTINVRMGVGSYFGTGLATVGVDGANPLIFVTNSAERMRLDSSGLVGIGTSSPSTILDIASSNSGLTITNTGASNKKWRLGGGSAGQFQITETGVADRLTIDTSGNVGSGTTTMTRNFNVGGSNAAVGLSLQNSGTSGRSYSIFSTNSSAATVGSLAFFDDTAGAYRMVLDSSGLVGIGTASPSTLLHISSANTSFTATSTTATSSTQLRVVTGAGTCYFAVDGSGGGSFGTANAAAVWNSINSPILFATNNSERMRIDSSGNVGIGTSSAGSFFDGARNLVVGSGSGAQGMTIYAGTTSSSNIFFADGTSTPAQYIGQIRYFHDNNYMMFVTNDGERMRITSAGFVGIGTTTPQSQLDLRGDSDGESATIHLKHTGASGRDFAITSRSDGSLRFADDTAGTERMRISSAGTLFIGATSSPASTQRLVLTADGGAGTEPLLLNELRTGTATENYVRFWRNGSEVGTIQNTSVATLYNTTSDYRLKENVVPMTGALAKVQALKPCTYKWKLNGLDGQGFIAHELQSVIPECVAGEKDAVDAEGKPKYQGIDTSYLVATLTAAIQEQQAIIENLTNRLTALEGN